MCETPIQSRNGTGSGRRTFLRAAGIATALGLAGGTFLGRWARADALTKAQRDKMTPDANHRGHEGGQRALSAEVRGRTATTYGSKGRARRDNIPRRCF